MLLLAGNNSVNLCDRLSKRLDADMAKVEKKRFPDGELYLRILTDLSGEDVLMVSDTRSDGGILETILLLEAARGMNPKNLTLFVPYFSYMRQHMRYASGEPISSKVLVEIYSRYADSIATVDIHDEETLGFSSKPFHNMKITGAVKDYYEPLSPDLVVSPDDGGIDRARSIAKMLGATPVQMDKIRIDSRHVEIKVPDGMEFKGKKVLLIDDIISTGGTMIKAIELLRSRGVANLSVCAIHGLFVNESNKKISALADDLAVTNTVQGEYSKIDISSEVASHLKGV